MVSISESAADRTVSGDQKQMRFLGIRMVDLIDFHLFPII